MTLGFVALYLVFDYGNELYLHTLPGTRTISGSSNASAKDITVAIQEVSEEKGEGVKETTEVPITAQART